MPASSKMELLLSKAEPIRGGGRASVITYLRRDKNSSQERGVRQCERNNSVDTKVSKQGGGGGTPGARTEIPLQTVMKTMVRQVVPLQSMEVHGGADIYLQPTEYPTPEQEYA